MNFYEYLLTEARSPKFTNDELARINNLKKKGLSGDELDSAIEKYFGKDRLDQVRKYIDSIEEQPDNIGNTRYNEENSIEEWAKYLNDITGAKETKTGKSLMKKVMVDRHRYIFYTFFKKENPENPIPYQLLVKKSNGVNFENFFKIDLSKKEKSEDKKGGDDRLVILTNDKELRLVNIPRKLLEAVLRVRNRNIKNILENEGKSKEEITSELKKEPKYIDFTDKIRESEANIGTYNQYVERVEFNMKYELSKLGLHAAIFNDESPVYKENPAENKEVQETNDLNLVLDKNNVKTIIQKFINNHNYINYFNPVTDQNQAISNESDFSILSYGRIKQLIKNSTTINDQDKNSILSIISKFSKKSYGESRQNLNANYLIGSSAYLKTVQFIFDRIKRGDIDKLLNDHGNLNTNILAGVISKFNTKILKESGLTKDVVEKKGDDTIVTNQVDMNKISEFCNVFFSNENLIKINSEWEDEVIFPYINGFIKGVVIRGNASSKDGINSAFIISDTKTNEIDKDKNTIRKVSFADQKKSELTNVIKMLIDDLFDETGGKFFIKDSDIKKDVLSGKTNTSIIKNVKRKLLEETINLWSTESPESIGNDNYYDTDIDGTNPHKRVVNQTFSLNYGPVSDDEVMDAINSEINDYNKNDNDSPNKSKFFVVSKAIDSIIRFMYSNESGPQRQEPANPNENYNLLISKYRSSKEPVNWYKLCEKDGKKTVGLEMFKTIINNL